MQQGCNDIFNKDFVVSAIIPIIIFSVFDKMEMTLNGIILSGGWSIGVVLINFIKEHQDLNITLILDNMHLLKNAQFDLKDVSNEKLKIYTKKHLRGLHVENKTDVVFIDTASYTYDDEVSMYLYNLNSDYNKNQWVIKFG